MDDGPRTTDHGLRERRPPPSSVVRRLSSVLWRLPRLALVGVVRLYQGVVSPWLPATCRYSPTCSQYAVLSLQKYGALKGSVLAIWRILRCNPWGGHGHDPPRWFGEPERGTDGPN